MSMKPAIVLNLLSFDLGIENVKIGSEMVKNFIRHFAQFYTVLQHCLDGEPDPFFWVQPNFGPDFWVQMGRVGPQDSKMGWVGCALRVKIQVKATLI